MHATDRARRVGGSFHVFGQHRKDQSNSGGAVHRVREPRALVEPLEGRRLFAVSYTLADLGQLTGYADVTAKGLNAKGEVVGYAGRAEPHYTVESAQAFVYRGGKMAPVGGKGSIATGINDAGTIVGAMGSSATTVKPFATVNGVVTDLSAGILGGSFVGNWAIPHAINNNGQVAGEAINADWGDQGAFVYTLPTSTRPGSLRNIPGDSNDGALAINAAGAAAGFTGPVIFSRAFVAGGATMTYIDPLGGSIFDSATGRGINDAGEVVGESPYGPQESFGLHAFLYSGGQVRDLGALPGQDFSAANDINNLGTVVGNSGGRAIVVTRGGAMTDLNALVTRPTGVTLTDAVAVNDAGQIAVNGTLNGKSRAYLLTPIKTVTPSETAKGSISGRIFFDANKDRVRQSSERYLGGRQVYIDRNRNNKYDTGEPLTRTDTTGTYKFTGLADGKHRVRPGGPAGRLWAAQPAPKLGYVEVTVNKLVNGGAVTGKNFGDVVG